MSTRTSFVGNLCFISGTEVEGAFPADGHGRGYGFGTAVVRKGHTRAKDAVAIIIGGKAEPLNGNVLTIADVAAIDEFLGKTN